jgi:hypothetical protein
VRLQNGTAQVQDGPFLYTKEQLGGFFLIEAPDLRRARGRFRADMLAIRYRTSWSVGGHRAVLDGSAFFWVAGVPTGSSPSRATRRQRPPAPRAPGL